MSAVAAIAMVLGQVAAGALWRGVLDGWKSWAYWTMRYRWLLWLWDTKQDPLEPVLRRSVIVSAGMLLTWPLWLWAPLWVAVAGSVAMMLYYVMGHKVDRWTVWPRYLVVGSIGYAVIMPRWPERWRSGDFVDGGMRIGAFWAGGAGWGCLLIAVLTRQQWLTYIEGVARVVTRYLTAAQAAMNEV